MSEDAAPEIEPPALPSPEPVYVIELGFPPDTKPNWRVLGAVAGTRRKPRPLRLLWHDTPGRDLARHQLALCKENDLWRLSALRPNKQHAWPPLGLPPVILETANSEDLGLPDAPLAPVASFAGQARAVEITHDHGTVAIRWVDGQLQGVADTAPIARLSLSGPPAAVRVLALALADQGAFVPLASMAASAVALAEHAPPVARHKGASYVPEGANLADGMAFVIGQLVDAAFYWASEIPLAATPEPVHQMRVAVRRLRSLLGMVRKADMGALWRTTKTQLGDLARELGEAREWDVFLEGTGAEMIQAWPDDPRVTTLIGRATKRRAAVYATLRANLASPQMRRLAMELALFATLRLFTVPDDLFWQTDIRTFAAHALRRRARKLLAAGEDLAALPLPALHEVRKNAKRLRYGTEFFADFWGGKATRKYLERLGELQEALGEINDAVSVEPLLAKLGPCGFAAGMAVGIATERSMPALQDAQNAWRKLCAGEGFWEES
jgi:triphosphatase